MPSRPGIEVADEHLIEQARVGKPLAILMHERVRELRAWAQGRCLPAD